MPKKRAEPPAGSQPDAIQTLFAKKGKKTEGACSASGF
jgi:hypothetical protein